MVQFLSINFFSWISSIFIGLFKSSRFFVSLCTSREAKDRWSLITISLPFSYVISYFCTPADKQKWHKALHMKFCSPSIHDPSAFLSSPYAKPMITVTSEKRYVTELQKTRCFCCFKVCRWARCFRRSGDAIGWGTTLQTGRSWVRFPMMSLEFFIDISLPPALWSWGRVSL